MSEVVGKYHLGIVSDDFTSKSLALALNTLTAEDIMAYKSNSHCAAQIECADENENIMTVICESLIGGVA
jgi:fibronectin type 3 domain-containing protein